MAANWQCKCGEIVYCNGEPDSCMQCGAGEWHIYIPTAEEIADEDSLRERFDLMHKPAEH